VPRGRGSRLLHSDKCVCCMVPRVGGVFFVECGFSLYILSTLWSVLAALLRCVRACYRLDGDGAKRSSITLLILTRYYIITVRGSANWWLLCEPV
jgi:hypothetical protein